MIEAQESVTGTITGTISINAVVNNGTVIPEEIDPTVPSHVKAITEEDIARWNDKADTNHKHDEYLTAIPNEYITEEELNNKGYLTEHQDLSEYATIEALNQKAEATHTHSQYLTEVPSEYVTDSELNNKGYLTQEDLGDIDLDINSISDETIEEIVNLEIVNANEVSY